MFVRLKKSAGTVNPVVQIVESYRADGKVKQRVLASLGTIKDDSDLERLRIFAQNMIAKIQQERTKQKSLFEDLPPEVAPFDKKPSRSRRKPKEPKPTICNIEDLVHKATIYDGFVSVVERLFVETGFSQIPVHKPVRMAFDPLRIAKILVAQRLFAPTSKLRTYQRQNDLGIDDLKLHQIYRGMDSLLTSEELFQRCAFAAAHESSEPLLKEEIECLFIDVTTLYFESVDIDELRKFGFSKDHKFHSVQIVLCLVVNSDGLPVAYETFPGNTAEVSTVLPMLDKLKLRFDVKKITIVCDRGLASRANIEKLGFLGIGYVAACKIKHLPAAMRLNDLNTYSILEKNESDEIRVLRVTHPRYPNSDLIVTWSSKRAAKDRSDRERILSRLESKLGKEVKSPKVKKLVTNNGYRQFVKIDGDGKWQINEAALVKAASWDGFHALAVSKSSNLSNEAALAQYRNLWRVEEAFRVSKSQLEIRPMFHWTPDRIRAHVLICFIALFIERYLERQLRSNGRSLTPDRIRYALQQVHSIHFQDMVSGQCSVMQSTLPKDAQDIFSTLKLPTKRNTYLL